MTEQRRWQVFRQLRQWISTADEFVMYLTDDYYDSWWTRAELLALASLVAPPPIHVIDPETGRRSSQTVDNLVVALSATDDADLTRLQYFAFAPEWLHRMRRPDADLLPPLVSNLYTEEVAERFLRHERRMPCPRCHRRGTGRLRSLADVIRRRPSEVVPADLIRLSNPAMSVVDISPVQQIARCQGCGAEYEIERAGSISWWYPFRDSPNGEATCAGPDDACIELQDVWRLVDSDRS